jgi:hypothetical protein
MCSSPARKGSQRSRVGGTREVTWPRPGGTIWEGGSVELTGSRVRGGKRGSMGPGTAGRGDRLPASLALAAAKQWRCPAAAALRAGSARRPSPPAHRRVAGPGRTGPGGSAVKHMAPHPAAGRSAPQPPGAPARRAAITALPGPAWNGSKARPHGLQGLVLPLPSAPTTMESGSGVRLPRGLRRPRPAAAHPAPRRHLHTPRRLCGPRPPPRPRGRLLGRGLYRCGRRSDLRSPRSPGTGRGPGPSRAMGCFPFL